MKASGVHRQAAKIWQHSNKLEMVLAHLREHGLSKMESIRAVREICQMTLGEAKKAVHLSQTWQDVAQRDEELETKILEALGED